MLRLKGLTSGGLPTFLEIGQSFASGALREDNLVHQLHCANRSASFVGDDAWAQLFPPPLWSAAHPLPSLDVRDLDSVDAGVSAILPDLIDSGSGSGLVIGHTLGVDHVGHLHSITHPEMRRKLAEADALLEAVLRQVEGTRTLLVVMGDHGQTATGDHGGASPEETDSALWAFDPSLAAPAVLFAHPAAERDASSGDDASEVAPPAAPLLPQLDFAASLAALLGLPLPFSNLGRIHPDLYSLGLTSRRVEQGASFKQELARAALTNARQVVTYLEAYVDRGGALDAAAVAFLRGALSQLQDGKLHCNGSDAVKCSAAAAEILAQAAELGRRQFTQFNECFMVAAFALLIGFFFFSLVSSYPQAFRLIFFCSLNEMRLFIARCRLECATVIILIIRSFGVLSDNFILYEPVVSLVTLTSLFSLHTINLS